MSMSMKEIVDKYNDLCLSCPEIHLQPVKRFRSKAAGQTAIKTVENQVDEYWAPKGQPEDIYLEPGQLTSRVKGIPVQPDNTICSRVEAIEKGYLLYWNGTPCPNRGHIAPRYMKTGWCKRCYQIFRADEITQPEIDKELLPKRKRR